MGSLVNNMLRSSIAICLVAFALAAPATSTMPVALNQPEVAWLEPSGDLMFTTYRSTGPSSNTDSCLYAEDQSVLQELCSCWSAAYDKYWHDAQSTKFPVYEPHCTGHESYPGGWIGRQIRRVTHAFVQPIEPKSAVAQGNCSLSTCRKSYAVKETMMVGSTLVHSCTAKEVN